LLLEDLGVYSVTGRNDSFPLYFRNTEIQEKQLL